MALDVIITGCRLVDPLNRRSLWGDLWHDTGVYIFNGCLESKGEAAWNYSTDPICLPDKEKQLTITAMRYFERRGVIVLPLEGAALNEAAIAYIRKTPKV